MFLKKKSLITILAAIIATALLCFGATAFTQSANKAYAYTSANLPAETNTVANIYDGGKFNEVNLNALAKKAGYNDLSAMITAAKGGEIKTAADFGHSAIKFGKSSAADTELAWIPAYLSNSTEGAILTLWLASTINLSTYEASSWTDGKYSNDPTPNPSSNNYSVSYIRALINNGGTYYGEWSGVEHPKKKSLEKTDDNKFAMFANGELAKYITAPSSVSWQANANYLKNDPKWSADADGNYTGSGHYSNEWLNDKLWLPSVYEVYDGITPVGNPTATAFTNNGGLWQLNEEELSNSSHTYLRSGHPTDYASVYDVNRNGKDVSSYRPYSAVGVRPALHLNLSAVAKEIKSNPFEVSANDTTTRYATIEEAWKAANEVATTAEHPATVSMLADATTTQTLVVKSGAHIILEMKKHKLALDENASGSVIKVEGTFTVQRGSTDGISPQHDIIDPVTKRKVSISNSLITGGKGSGESKLGGGVFVDKGGEFTLGGYVAIAGNTAGYGGGVRVDVDAKFTMKDYAFINYNKATYDGGGLCVCNAQKIELHGRITNNASAAGGGIYFEGDERDYVLGSRCQIENNSVTTDSSVGYSGRGGGIYIDGCTVKAASGSEGSGMISEIRIKVTNNTATVAGGGVYAAPGEKQVGDKYVHVSSRLEVKDAVSIGYNKVAEAANNVFLADDSLIAVTGNLTKMFSEIYVNNTGVVAIGYTKSDAPSTYFISDNNANDCVWISDAATGAVSIGTHTGGTATCSKKAICTNCDAEYGEKDSTKHNPDEDDGDCSTAITCKDCGTVITAAKTHSYGSSYASDGAEHWHICQNSGCTKTDTKTAHGYDQNVVSAQYLKTEATCTQKAVYYKSCVCGAHGAETFESGNVAAHMLTEIAKVNKTCTTDGVLAHDRCSVCGKNFINGVEKTAAELKIPAGHSFGTWIEEVAATCSANGVKGHKDCSVCGKNFDGTDAEIADLTIVINEDAHSWDDGTITTSPTCSQDGVKTFTCEHNAAHKRTEPISVDPAAHVYAADWTSDKTGHWHAAACEHTAEKSGFAAHTASDWIVDTPAQVNVAGSKHKECTVCGYTVETETISALTDTLVKPSENGGENTVVVTSPKGFTPDVELVVTEIERKNYGAYENIVQTVNGKIDLVYDVTLKSNGVTVQPDGTLTVKLLIPLSLRGKNFKLFHLYEGTATDTEYTLDGNYAVVTANKLSEFIFVGEKAVAPTPTPTPMPDGEKGLSAGAIAGITIGAVLVALFIAYIVCYFVLYRKDVLLKGKAWNVIYTPMNAIFNKHTKK